MRKYYEDECLECGMALTFRKPRSEVMSHFPTQICQATNIFTSADFGYRMMDMASR